MISVGTHSNEFEIETVARKKDIHRSTPGLKVGHRGRNPVRLFSLSRFCADVSPILGGESEHYPVYFALFSGAVVQRLAAARGLHDTFQAGGAIGPSPRYEPSQQDGRGRRRFQQC